MVNSKDSKSQKRLSDALYNSLKKTRFSSDAVISVQHGILATSLQRKYKGVGKRHMSLTNFEVKTGIAGKDGTAVHVAFPPPLFPLVLVRAACGSNILISTITSIR